MTSSPTILLYSMPSALMLIIERPSGVVYQNQVGGNVCEQARLEGVLAPLGLDPPSIERIMRCSYGMQGITGQTADIIDSILASDSEGKYVKVDRLRLEECLEAWVYVIVESPMSTDPMETPEFFGGWCGFGRARAVLTWPNSD
jgi:hypothetical protein